jgi:hypothetical protein
LKEKWNEAMELASVSKDVYIYVGAVKYVYINFNLKWEEAI